MPPITPSLVLALAVLAIFPFLTLLAGAVLAAVVLHRMSETQRVALENLDRMARKVCSMSEKPPAHQLAAMEAARSLSAETSDQMPLSELDLVQ